jgi:hypothetical protein
MKSLSTPPRRTMAVQVVPPDATADRETSSVRGGDLDVAPGVEPGPAVRVRPSSAASTGCTRPRPLHASKGPC